MANFQGGISTVTRTSAPASTPSYTPSGGGGYGGGGGSYTVSYEKPKEDIDDINAQLANAGNMLDRELPIITQTGKDSLNNIQNQRKANNLQLLMKNAQISRNSEWQPNQQKEQSVLSNMRRVMGNAAYGSGMQDLQEGMSRFDDMADVELINTWKENQDNAYNNWYQANSDLINDYNEQVIKTRSAFDEAYNNYLSNIANINAELGKKAYAAKNGGKITQDIDDGTLTVDLRKDNAKTSNGMDALLKLLTNQASSNNPNIPDTGGAIDYIRPDNAVSQRVAKGNGGVVNISAGAFIPTPNRNLPGYNYQRNNFAGYRINK